MFIPIGTTAGAYYRICGTLGLIAANVLCFALLDPLARPDLLMLQVGRIAPWQWITCVFSHADLFHLLGNMLFLFFFGGIVEGRMGWKRFLPLYFAMAAAGGLLTQIFMLGITPEGPTHAALGASGVINGLLVICIFWAPRERFTCLLFIWFRPLTFELPLWGLGAIYVGLDLLFAAGGGFVLGTSVLHLIGAATGVPPALWLPRTGWVYLGDWEGLIDPLPPADGEVPPPRRAAPASTAPAPKAAGAVPLSRLLAEGRHEEALPRLLALAEAGRTDSDRARLRAGELLVVELERPRRGLEVLAPLDAADLPAEERDRLAHLRAEAQRQIADGVIEIGE